VDTIRKIFKWLLVLFIAALLLDVFLVASFAVFSAQYEKADAIIVMGAAINSPSLYNRSLEALNLYEAGYAEVLVLSGGRISDKDISEAGYMQKAIQSKASKPLNFILEEESRSTFENLKNSKAKFPEAQSVIIVTDKYHLARAVLLAKRLGFKQVFWSAPKAEYSKQKLQYQYLREVVAMMAYLPKFVSK
jgi:uncharacterized SAM-binding protein YcdF (DUF218 family)